MKKDPVEKRDNLEGSWQPFDRPTYVVFRSRTIDRAFVLAWREVSKWDDDEAEYMTYAIDYLFDNGDRYRVSYERKDVEIEWQE